MLEDALFQLQDLPIVRDIRNYGMLAGIELVPKDATVFSRQRSVSKSYSGRVVHVKATGDTLIIAPPFVMEEKGF